MDTLGPTKEEQLLRRRMLLSAFVAQGNCNVIFDARHSDYVGPFSGESSIRMVVFAFKDEGAFARLDNGEQELLLPYESIISFHDTYYDEWYVFGTTLSESTSDTETKKELLS